MGRRRTDGEIIVAGDLAMIPLAGGGFALIDALDLPLVEGRVWHQHPGPFTRYAATKAGDDRILMHQAILGLRSGVDHRSGHGLDNRRSNLRAATKAQNAQNMTLRKDNKSGFKGVSLHAISGTWRACIVLDGRQKSLGYHPTARAAAAAYDLAALEHFGPFATTNQELGLL